MSKVIVIGSGFGGLGAAIRLAAAGHDVEIFEKLDKPGGRAYVFEMDGFKFDAGPTVITAPFLFDDLWAVAGKRREDYFDLVPVDPFYRIFDWNKNYFDYNNDEAFILDEIAKFNPDDREGYQRFMGTTKAIFEKGFVELADKPFLTFMDMLKVAPDLIRLQSYLSVYQYASKFVKNEFLRRCFSFHPLLIGGNPFDSPSIYAMIHYLEREWGIWYALGGTGSIVKGMVRLFEELGGKIHLKTEIDKIEVDQKRATGVTLKDGTFVPADHVVANADVSFVYENMIDKNKQSWYLRTKMRLMKHSMSLFVIYFGTKKQYRNHNLSHHNIILGERYNGLLEDIFQKKTLSQDFSLYLHMPTLTDPSVAPEGHEGFYVLSPVPHLGSGIDWTKAAKPYRDLVMNFLEDNYIPDLNENLVAEHYIDPLHFKGHLNSRMGSAFSVQPLLSQSAWFRPHNRSEDFENLYFVGAGTHPGAGLPGVLSSSIIAQDLIGPAESTPRTPRSLSNAHHVERV